MTEAKITQLEVGLAHQQRLCEQLNEVVTDHTRHIMQLERVIAELRKQLSEMRAARKQDRTQPDERPPHY